MEARVLLVCLFVAAIVRGEQAPAGLCRSNERLLECGCPRTCRDPAPNCKAVCRTGCFCEEGQVRNDEGICVNLADCPPILSAYKQDTTEPRPNGGKCGDNEEYRYCEPCNKTCDNPNPICPAQCSRGCFCKNGLLRDRNGTCVTPDKCSKILPDANTTTTEVTCKEHQVYKRCETREKTCRKPNPRIPSPCVTGCFCEEGYVKAPSGTCVKLEECPKGDGKMDPTSPPMRSLRQSNNQTQATRNNQSSNVGLTTPTEVQVDLLTGPMVHDSQPSHHDPTVEDCSPDEEYFSCGWCEPTCSYPLPSCPKKVCMRGCQCRPPLLRHHSGRCVEAKDCFPETCHSPNEKFLCLFGCEPRCDGRCNRPRYCVLGCYCKLGFLRDSTGHCVVKERCTNSTEIKGIPVNLKKKIPNDENVFKTLTWRSLY